MRNEGCPNTRHGAPGLILNSLVEGELVSVTPVLWSQTLSDGSAEFGPEAAPQKLNRASILNGVLLTRPQFGEPAGTALPKMLFL